MTTPKKSKYKVLKIAYLLFLLLYISFNIYNSITIWVLPRWHRHLLAKTPTERLVFSKTPFIADPKLGDILSLVAVPANAAEPKYIYVIGSNETVKCTLSGTVVERIHLCGVEESMQMVPGADGYPIAFFQQGMLGNSGETITLYDAKGHTRWTRYGEAIYGTAGHFTDPKNYTFAVGAYAGGNTQLLDVHGKSLWVVDDDFTYPCYAYDVNGDGCDELIYRNYASGNLIIRDGKGHIVKQVKPASSLVNLSLTRWPDATGRVYILVVDDEILRDEGILRLMDFNGKVVKEFLLPREKKYTFYYTCYGSPVRCTRNSTGYYAMLVNMNGNRAGRKSYFAVYDRHGAMVYYDRLMRDIAIELHAFLTVPTRGNPRWQDVLVGLEHGTVLRYSYQRSEAVH